MNHPRISIVMPVYNGARFVAEALASVQSEPGIEAEIIVVDDGSTDQTTLVVSSLAANDPRISLLQCEHKGVSAARNVGVKAARLRLRTSFSSPTAGRSSAGSADRGR